MSDPYYVTDLESGSVWTNTKTGITLTYAFWNHTPSYDTYFYENNNFQAFTVTMQTAVSDAFALIHSFANISFSQILAPQTPTMETTVQIGFGMASLDPNAEAWAYYPDPGNGQGAGDVWANGDYFTTFFPSGSPDPTASHVLPGDYDYQTILHEIGHTLGLKHSFEAPALPPGEDSEQYTVMSYTNPDNYGGTYGLYPETYMPYDIAAIQALYGANMTDTGDNNYVLNANHIYTIWDAGGNDTLDGSAQSMNMTLDLRAGHYSSVGDIAFSNGFTLSQNIAIAFGTVIENAQGGSGNDTIYDNAAANNIQGNAGNDTIYLSSGNDTVGGGDGNDTVYLAVGNESIDGGNGTDTVVFNGSYFDYSYVFDIPNNTVTVTGVFGTDALSNDEDFQFTDYTFTSLSAFQTGFSTVTITGDNSANILAGDQFSPNHDIISGLDGNDTLSGFGGPDLLLGGNGNDTLYGGAQNDILDGGPGVDTLIGGTDNDTYIVDAIVSSGVVKLEDIAYELPNEGTDTLRLRTNGDLGLLKPSTLVLGLNLENFDASQTGSNKLNLTGNAGSNVLTGNDWDNTLNGGVGTGATDTLIGGLGNDTLILNHASDVVTENAGEGTDTVVIAYAGAGPVSLSSYANVENLKVTGAGLYNLQGDSNDNMLTGNSSANVLTGGDGNDTYVVGTGDIVIETLTGGIDTIVSTVTASLMSTAFDNVENLTLGGTATNATGDSGANILTGNGANNILDGGGGADTMFGGGGSDTYIVDNINDMATENVSAGTDTVKSSVSFDLSTNGRNVDNLTLVTGAGNINGTGNALINTITGNEGNNTLDGGQGADILRGGLGNDLYIVDVVNSSGLARIQDLITDTGGTDTLVLRTYIDIGVSPTTLTLVLNVENFDISGTFSNKLNITGNGLNNVMTGNDWDNTINGGVGADTLYGGNGNDTLGVDNAFDTAYGGSGTDTILSTITWDMGTTPVYGHNNTDVENLTLGGTSIINGTGNDLDNTITGNSVANVVNGGIGADHLLGLAGADTLIGGLDNDILEGGLGIDTLTGGAGVDTFVYHAGQSFAATSADIITDFQAGLGGDKLDIHDILVGYPGGGNPIDNWLHLKTSANGLDTIVSIDANPAANATAFVQIATLQNVTGYTADDLLNDGNLIT